MKTFSNRLNIDYEGSDLSNSLSDFNADTETITLANTEYIYISKSSRFNHIYVALATASTVSNTISVEVYSGSEWLSIEAIDDTKGFTRDGFITINSEAIWNASTYSDFYGCHLRLSVAEDTSAMVVQAINILLSDDRELVKEFPAITQTDFKLGATSFNPIHQSVRDGIIQDLRNQGVRKIDGSIFDAFDLVDIEEVRLAATYMALSKIFMNVSDNPEDNWRVKSVYYNELGKRTLASAPIHTTTGVKKRSYIEVSR